MSDTPSVVPAAEDGSLRSRLATRRSELRDQRPFDLDVPGYKGVLKARYHVLDYPAVRAIGDRHKDVRNRAEAELKVAADTLSSACDCLLEVSPDGEVKETEYRWSWQTARDLFGVPAGEVPDGSLARVALQRIIPNSISLMLHYAEYDLRSRDADEEVVDELEGEYEAT